MKDNNEEIAVYMTQTERGILLDALEYYYDHLDEEYHANKVRLSYRTKEKNPDYDMIATNIKYQKLQLDIIDSMWELLTDEDK